MTETWKPYTGRETAEEGQPAVIFGRYIPGHAKVAWYSVGKFYDDYGRPAPVEDDAWIFLLPVLPELPELEKGEAPTEPETWVCGCGDHHPASADRCEDCGDRRESISECSTSNLARCWINGEPGRVELPELAEMEGQVRAWLGWQGGDAIRVRSSGRDVVGNAMAEAGWFGGLSPGGMEWSVTWRRAGLDLTLRHPDPPAAVWGAAWLALALDRGEDIEIHQEGGEDG